MRRWMVVAGVAALLLVVVIGAGAAVIYGNALGENGGR